MHSTKKYFQAGIFFYLVNMFLKSVNLIVFPVSAVAATEKLQKNKGGNSNMLNIGNNHKCMCIQFP